MTPSRSTICVGPALAAGPRLPHASGTPTHRVLAALRDTTINGLVTLVARRARLSN